jgi:hypothetical protein
MNGHVIPFAELKFVAKRQDHEADYSFYLVPMLMKCGYFTSTIPIRLNGVQPDAWTTVPVNSLMIT